MMSVPATNKTSPTSSSSHPRRRPAHLSVSLRHEGQKPTAERTAKPSIAGISKLKSTTTNDYSDENDEALSEHGVGNWFDRSNKHPKVVFSQALEGNEPPYYIPRISSNASNDMYASRQINQYGLSGHLRPAATISSSTDDFRSVIDDLTIENKKLRERLRKYEQAYTPELEKYKLFEVKVHALPSQKRRELEAQLHAFASSLADSGDDGSPDDQVQLEGYPAHKKQKLFSSSSTSNSRPIDSAYASMSNSGPSSASNPNPGLVRKGSSRRSKTDDDETIQNFLHNIPQGLLPKLSPVMTERQKQKIVVQRLEQLFTGKRGAIGGPDSHPLQQQEVSKSAARANKATSDSISPIDGVREAHMLPCSVDMDIRPGKLFEQSSTDTQIIRDTSDTSGECSPGDSDNEQRPTRPLDLDPDRAQIPSDNMDYIRHLGQSTPQLTPFDSVDAEPNARGWVYLNILVNMAQLHIINVTPDFIRHAVQDVSEKFQLSKDGNKIRWRGGSRPTQLSSSDSGSNSVATHSPNDSDSLDEVHGKRRRVDKGRFASVPIDVQRPHKPSGNSARSISLHYKPLFNHHRGSSLGDEWSSDGDGFRTNYGAPSNVKMEYTSSDPNPRHGHSKPEFLGKRRRDDGPIIFYSGARFCTDLCGDGEIPLPLHESSVGADGFSNHTRDALGCASRPIMPRTSSGSPNGFRPLEELDTVHKAEFNATTPSVVESEDSDEEMFLDEPLDVVTPPRRLQAFDASGLGGTQPADHFAVHVETKRTKTRDPIKLSRFSAPGVKAKKFYHSIPKSALDSFVGPDSKVSEDSISEHLASLAASSSPSPAAESTVSEPVLPFKHEIISTKYVRLEPSELPAPTGYYGNSTASESDSSEYGEQSSPEISSLLGHNNNHNPYFGKSQVSVNGPETSYFHRNSMARGEISHLTGPSISPEHEDDDNDNDNEEEEEEGSDDNSDDSSDEIDMLAHEREVDPESVRRKEEDFEDAKRRGRELEMRLNEATKPRSSVATIAESEDEIDDDISY